MCWTVRLVQSANRPPAEDVKNSANLNVCWNDNKSVRRSLSLEIHSRAHICGKYSLGCYRSFQPYPAVFFSELNLLSSCDLSTGLVGHVGYGRKLTENVSLALLVFFISGVLILGGFNGFFYSAVGANNRIRCSVWFHVLYFKYWRYKYRNDSVSLNQSWAVLAVVSSSCEF